MNNKWVAVQVAACQLPEELARQTSAGKKRIDNNRERLRYVSNCIKNGTVQLAIHHLKENSPMASQFDQFIKTALKEGKKSDCPLHSRQIMIHQIKVWVLFNNLNI
jgi:hypothetical protein